MTQRYKMTLAYDGTRYAGWQVQPQKLTVQGELERVLNKLTGEKQRVHCSGRTDSGVHARAQVAHFDLDAPAKIDKLRSGLNALLDHDIRVNKLKAAPQDFHARLSTVGKEYRYHIWNGVVVPPPLRLYRAQVTTPLDTDAMKQAARHLVGRHDFLAFSANPNREVGDTVRELSRLDIRRRGHEITIIAVGEGFLYKMVRSLAGFLIRAGLNEAEPHTAATILESKTRTARVPTAPPQGLFLWQVFYG